MPNWRTNNFPESGRGLGHVTPTIFDIRSNISLKLLELETSNLIHGFVWAMPSRRIDNFPESRRGLGHVTPTIFGSTVGYPSDSLASCTHRIHVTSPSFKSRPWRCSLSTCLSVCSFVLFIPQLSVEKLQHKLDETINLMISLCSKSRSPGHTKIGQ